MLGPEQAHHHLMHLALDPLSLGVLALECEGHGQVARTRQRVRMLGPEHALSHLMQLALHPLSVGVLALV
jgi:hypothetical protein